MPASFAAGLDPAPHPRPRARAADERRRGAGGEPRLRVHRRPARRARESLTPQIDALAEEGTLLTHAYSTGNRTIRAIEATTSSLPPLPGVSIVRRPQSEDLFTLPALLRARGYQTLFVYGGRALFDGMGGYLRHNGVDRIVEQKDFPDGTFKTAWGVADEAIFDRALTEMDGLHATGQPVLHAGPLGLEPPAVPLPRGPRSGPTRASSAGRTPCATPTGRSAASCARRGATPSSRTRCSC